MGHGPRADSCRADFERDVFVWLGERSIRRGMGAEVSEEVRDHGDGRPGSEFHTDVPRRSRIPGRPSCWLADRSELGTTSASSIDHFFLAEPAARAVQPAPCATAGRQLRDYDLHERFDRAALFGLAAGRKSWNGRIADCYRGFS